MAEYRELPMIAGSLRRSLKSKKGLPPIPNKYLLGKGHVSFFYNKGLFLSRRYSSLINELLIRGYNLDLNRVVDFQTFKDNGLYNDWVADYSDLGVNVSRINQRLLEKLRFYRYYSRPLQDYSTEIFEDILSPKKLFY
jgi:deoxyribonuclease (pyrimidine dimer)